jgi:hypothetical protein
VRARIDYGERDRLRPPCAIRATRQEGVDELEVEAVEDGQAGIGPVDLGHGDGREGSALERQRARQ